MRHGKLFESQSIFFFPQFLRAELPSTGLCYFLYECNSSSGVSWAPPVLCFKEWVENKAKIFVFIFILCSFSFFFAIKRKKMNQKKECLSGTSLVGVVHGVRVAPSLAFYGSDPMYLLRVLVYKMTVELVLCTRSISYRGQLTI